jgi:hypothetical protein
MAGICWLSYAVFDYVTVPHITFVVLQTLTVCVLHRACGQLPCKAVLNMAQHELRQSKSAPSFTVNSVSHSQLRHSQSAYCKTVQCSTSTPAVNAHHSSWTSQPLSETRPTSHRISTVAPQAASSCDNVDGFGQWMCIVPHRWQRKAGLRVKCYHMGGVDVQ